MSRFQLEKSFFLAGPGRGDTDLAWREVRHTLVASGARSSASLACLLGVPDRPRYETRPPLRNRCALPAVRAAGSRFRSGIGTVSAGRCTLGRLFGRAGTARPSPWRSALARCMGDRVHVMNSWQSSRKRPVFMHLAKCIT